jgi:hypothetical protein
MFETLRVTDRWRDRYDLRADAFDWAAQRRQPTLLIRTESGVGLTEQHIRELQGFGQHLAATTCSRIEHLIPSNNAHLSRCS